MSFKTPVLVVAALSVGTALGWQLRTGDTSVESAGAEPHSIAISTPFASREPAGFDMERLREVMREELMAARTASDTRPPAAAPKPVTPEVLAQRRAAADEIEAMIRGGEWGNEQRASFHQQMTMLDPDQAARLLREVTIAFNQGTMRVTTDGPPL